MLRIENVFITIVKIHFGGHMRKVLAILVLIALFLAGCTGKEEVVTKPTQTAEEVEQILNIGAVKDFKKATEGRSLVFETLVDVDKYGNLVPLLAESWEMSDDGLVYTFHLRRDVKFHDGMLFDAKAAKFALEWCMDRGASYAKYVDRVKVVDDYTIKVYFNEYYRVLTKLPTKYQF